MPKEKHFKTEVDLCARFIEVQLTDWKISAMKIAITSARRGFVTRTDFSHHKIDHRRFTAADGWLTKCECGAGWFARNIGLGFDIQHPLFQYPFVLACCEQKSSPDTGPAFRLHRMR